MPDKIVNHFVLADGSVARYDGLELENEQELLAKVTNMHHYELFNGVYTDLSKNSSGNLTHTTGVISATAEIKDVETVTITATGTKNRFIVFVHDSLTTGTPTTEIYRVSYPAESETYTFTNTNNNNYVTVTLAFGDGYNPVCSIADGNLDQNTTFKVNGVSVFTTVQTLNLTEPLKSAVGYDSYTFTDGKAIITPATGTANLTPVDLGTVSCCAIPCEKGDVFTLNGTPRSNTGTRPYMFVDSNNSVLFRSEETTAMIDFSVVAPASGTLVVNFLLANPHSVQKGYTNLSKKMAVSLAIKDEPLTNLPDYILNNLAYKPLGSLNKGYLCLSCDDGSEELATYTIPMLISKNVPCTFSLWSTSEVFTENHTSVVVDAITNHSCELAQHGNQIWAEQDGDVAYTETQLVEFFDTEQVFWDTLGLVPKSAVCPSHYNNALVRAVAGGRFGVVRSGLDYVSNYYTYYSSGARSNLFGISSQNVNGGNLDYWKTAIDYAYDNNKILNIYWHDFDLTTEQRAKLEAVIDYAKTKGITFCTLGDIATVL